MYRKNKVYTAFGTILHFQASTAGLGMYPSEIRGGLLLSSIHIKFNVKDFFFLLNVTTGKIKTAYVALACGAYSVGQHWL